LRVNFLLGAGGGQLSPLDTYALWERFSRVSLLATVDSLERGRDEFSIFVAYAAPFEFDIALERGIRRWFKRRRGVEETDA